MNSRQSDTPIVTVDGSTETIPHTLTINPGTLDIAPRDGKFTIIAGAGAVVPSPPPPGPKPRHKPTKAERQAKKAARKRKKTAKRRSRR